jgi:hypothetical protein
MSASAPSGAAEPVSSQQLVLSAMATTARARGRFGLGDLIETSQLSPHTVALLLSAGVSRQTVVDAAAIAIAAGLIKHQHGNAEWREDRELGLALLDGDGEQFNRLAGEVRRLISDGAPGQP